VGTEVRESQPLEIKPDNRMPINFPDVELSDRQFRHISKLTYDMCGIKLSAGKEGLVKSRLSKRLRALGLSNFERYLDFLARDTSGKELITLIDSLTTNKTSFFREEQHFEFFRSHLLPAFRTHTHGTRIWSAGCSSGEEPYSIAILLREEWPAVDQCDVRILATDISTRVLNLATSAVYEEDTVKEISPNLLRKYFSCVRETPTRAFHVNDNVRRMVRLARLNLMDSWPMKGPFHAIFCRNVMIYFDKQTQQELVRRFWEMLAPGGYLFVGHSESLTASSYRFRYVRPATYLK
jgi:chemotaxis protein methyltransferase CheR